MKKNLAILTEYLTQYQNWPLQRLYTNFKPAAIIIISTAYFLMAISNILQLGTYSPIQQYVSGREGSCVDQHRLVGSLEVPTLEVEASSAATLLVVLVRVHR